MSTIRQSDSCLLRFVDGAAPDTVLKEIPENFTTINSPAKTEQGYQSVLTSFNRFA